MNKTPQSNKYGIVRPDLSAHFDHSMVKLPNLKDQIIGGKRFYQVPGEGAPVWYPSVTTVTGWRDRDKWKKWREENAAKSKRILERGKQFHLTMESYLSNKDLIQELFGRPDLEAMFLQMKPRVDAFVNNIHGLEVPLYSKLMRLAGRMKDTFMCHDYFIQATAYAIMYQECTKIPVNQIVIMMVSAEGEEQAFVESPKKFVPELKERIDEFYAEFSPDQLVEEIKDGHAN